MARANAIYYATHDPFADFTTSPEISQVFGEIIGALGGGRLADCLGSPDPVLLAEAGPGRGTLMADALRAVGRAAPDFAAALRVHLIETSPRLRTAQAARVPEAVWHDSLDTLPEAPVILLANEFLDALPIRQFVRRGRGMDRSGSWPTAPESRQPAGGSEVPPGRDAAEGQIVELNEPARAFVAALAARVRRHPGVALLIDYGPMRSARRRQFAGARPPQAGRSAVGRRFGRPDRACGLCRHGGDGAFGGRRGAGTGDAGGIPVGVGRVRADRGAGAGTHRGSGGGAQGGHAAADRCSGDGRLVQGDGDRVPRMRDAAGTCGRMRVLVQGGAHPRAHQFAGRH